MAKLWVHIDHMPLQNLNHSIAGNMHTSPLMKTCEFITCSLIYYVFPVTAFVNHFTQLSALLHSANSEQFASLSSNYQALCNIKFFSSAEILYIETLLYFKTLYRVKCDFNQHIFLT